MIEAIHNVVGTGDQTDNYNFSILNRSGFSTISNIKNIATPGPFSPMEVEAPDWKVPQGSESSGDGIDVVGETQETPESQE